jgi:hypothetical protein
VEIFDVDLDGYVGLLREAVFAPDPLRR